MHSALGCVCVWLQPHLEFIDLLQARMESELVPVDTKRRPPALKKTPVLEEMSGKLHKNNCKNRPVRQKSGITDNNVTAQ